MKTKFDTPSILKSENQFEAKVTCSNTRDFNLLTFGKNDDISFRYDFQNCQVYALNNSDLIVSVIYQGTAFINATSDTTILQPIHNAWYSLESQQKIYPSLSYEIIGHDYRLDVKDSTDYFIYKYITFILNSETYTFNLCNSRAKINNILMLAGDRLIYTD